MRPLLHLALAAAPLPIAAPFILTDEEAGQIDRLLPASVCGLEKAEYSRYYWFDFVSAREGYQINRNRIRFIVLDDGARRVQAVADNPVLIEPDSKNPRIKAIATIGYPGGEIERIDCW
jgi:hypothetical protein